jgi:hypothetical protein
VRAYRSFVGSRFGSRYGGGAHVLRIQAVWWRRTRAAHLAVWWRRTRAAHLAVWWRRTRAAHLSSTQAPPA